MSDLFFILAILSAVWGIVSSIVISSFLSKRGIKVNLLFFRVLVLKYIHQYHKITKQENGKPGPWFYSYIISMNLALIFAIVGIVLKWIWVVCAPDLRETEFRYALTSLNRMRNAPAPLSRGLPFAKASWCTPFLAFSTRPATEHLWKTSEYTESRPLP